MAYTAWSVVFGEQPTASKWNILGTNDASFNDGTGFGSNVINDATLKYGKVRSRQGGSSTNWGTSGTTTYDYTGTNTFIQVGAITGNTDAADKAVTFPTAFNQIPVVFCFSQTAGSANVTDLAANSVTTTGFNVRNVGANATTETIAWLAIGQ